jgi:hypothetical protein
MSCGSGLDFRRAESPGYKGRRAGSKVTWQGKPLIVAEKIKKGDQVLKLREPNGVPVWSSHHRTKP